MTCRPRRTRRLLALTGWFALVGPMTLVGSAAPVGAAVRVPVEPAAAESFGAGAESWSWPLDPRPAVRRPFEPPPGPFAAGHRGVDLAGLVGQPVRSAGGGVVAFAGQVVGRGVVSIEHPGGLRTTYEPVAASVSAGERVGSGAVIGVLTAAPGHCLPGTCLHWGLRRGEIYLDPLGLLGAAAATRVRLLPVWGHDRGPLLARGRLRAGRAGPPRGGGSRRARCRRSPRAGRNRAPPRS